METVKSFDISIDIDGKIFDIHLNYKSNIININIYEKNSIPLKKFEKSFTKKEFEGINKFFRIFDDNLEIYNKIIELFNKKKFIGKIKEEEIIFEIKNDLVDFSLNIPLIKENKDINEIVKHLSTFVKDLKEENNVLKEKINQLENKCEKNTEEIKELKKEINKFKETNNLLSTILINNEEKNLITNWINPNSPIKYQLLYKASIDGDLMNTFHKKCDNKGPTLIIVKTTKGKRYGGYNPISWDTTDQWKSHPSTFIFSLDKKKKYIIEREDRKKYSSIGAKEHIGFGYYCGDILIYDKCTRRNDNRTNGKDSCYNITDKYEFTGEENVTISDYECFSVQF